ncbi:N-acetylglucosamine kinase [Erwinia endophytica]|uniref:BadF/BadG/BcrA/BcrD ATPase family protein n=1 Tax=Erwinia endophytica TaxID=1563158 RepID=UPI001265FFC7|nr:BadF/BadG/BcrA/BcrD ATPase family protein [Erwinia endophytica]KAB8306308.1 N-acetylglucosamine kinase [Erwinia endophytica]
MQSEFLLGIDGGGTHCRTRLTAVDGTVLAECKGGAANVYSDFDGALKTLNLLIEKTFLTAGLPLSAQKRTVAVLGLAGANVPSASARLHLSRFPFARIQLLSDVDIACIGAHRAEPGAVLIIGTGSQGAAWDGENFHRIGGWGFMLSDQGSGAILGQRLLRKSLLAHEELFPTTALTRRVMNHFSHSPDTLLNWSKSATPGDWGQFSPWVFEAAREGDSLAETLIAENAAEVVLMANALRQRNHGPLALMGGLATPLLPWLPQPLREKIVPGHEDALSGALRLARLG